MGDEFAKGLFGAVRPHCIRLVQIGDSAEYVSGSVDLLNELKALNMVLDNQIKAKIGVDEIFYNQPGAGVSYVLITPNLADYIMFPITQLLKKPSLTDSELENCLSVIKTLVFFCWCHVGALENQMISQMIPLVTFLLGGKPGNFSIAGKSEETLIHGVAIIRGLLYGSQNQPEGFVNSTLLNSKLVPTLGHMVSVLLNISLSSPVTKIRVDCLETLNLFYHIVDDGEILSLMFPGNVSTIAKLIKVKPPSDVVACCFTMLTTLVNQIFGDMDLNAQESDFLNLNELKDQIGNIISDSEVNDKKEEEIRVVIPQYASDKKHRTSEWLKATLVQFKKGLKIILNIDVSLFNKHNVSESVFLFGIKLVRNCFISCSFLIPLVLKSLSKICAVNDTYVSLITDSLIYSSMTAKMQALCINTLRNELQNVQEAFTSPNSDTTLDKIHYLILLIHLINELGESDDFVIEEVYLKLRETLSYLMKAKKLKDSKKKRLTSENEGIENQLLLVSREYIKGVELDIEPVSIFHGIFTKEIEKELIGLFKILASHGNIIDIIESQGIDYEVERGNILLHSVDNWLISSITDQIILNKSANSVDLNEFLDFSDSDCSNDDRTINGDDADNKSLVLFDTAYQTLDRSIEILHVTQNIHEYTYEIIASSVMSLRSIKNAVKILGNSTQDELINILYPVVESLASSNKEIRTESQLTAIEIANTLYNGSIQLMLKDNADYLVDAISEKMIGETLTPRLPIILTILIRIGSVDLLRDLDDIINTIFTLLDMYNEYPMLIQGFFLVFDEIINQIFKSVDTFDWDELEKEMMEDNINHHSMWGLQSMEDVSNFINRQPTIYEDLPEMEDDIVDESLKNPKILEVDSDESDSDIQTEEINSTLPGDDDDDDDKPTWISPLDKKLYKIVSDIFNYAQRMMQLKSITVTMTIMKTIKKMIPLLATQKDLFMPLAASFWDILVYTLENYKDLRIMTLTIEIMKELIRYLNTFFSKRFIEVFKLSQKNKFISSIISKQLTILKRKHAFEKSGGELTEINRSSVSTNWEFEMYKTLCDFLIFSLNKLGRFISNDVAISIIDTSLYYNDIEETYGYFEDLVSFIKEFRNY